MATIKVRLRRSSQNDKPGSVYYSIAHHSKVAQITTRYKLYSSEWDDRWETVVLLGDMQDRKLQQIQQQIKSDLAVFQRIIRMMDVSLKEYTAKDVVKSFKKSGCDVTFLTYMDERIKYLQKHDRLGTSQNYKHCKRSFSNFLQGSDILFQAITEELMLDYECWLKKREVSRKRALKKSLS